MNRMTTMIAALLVVVSASAVMAGEKGKPTATYEDFLEWGNRLEGRWVGKVTLIADWPGLDKKKGEVVAGHVSRRWVADKRGFVTTSYVANGEDRDFAYWDAAAKQIKLFIVGSGGTTWVVCVGRDGDGQWPWTAVGSLPDGTKTKGHGCDTLKGDGRHVIAGTIFIGDEELPKLHDVYERVSK